MFGMGHEFWHQRWQNNQIGFHLDQVNPWLQRYLPELSLSPNQRIFVPLCGKSLDMLWLQEQGYAVLGVEISPIAVQSFFSENRLTLEAKARGRFTSWRSGSIELLCGDFFDLSPDYLKEIVSVFDRAALIAFPADVRPRYVERLFQLINSGVHVLLITLEYPQEQMAGPPFSVTESEVGELFNQGFTIRLLQARNVLEAHPHFRDRGLMHLEEKAYLLMRR